MPEVPVKPTVVNKARFRPGKCMVTGDIDGPFLDCGIWSTPNQEGERVYLQTAWVEQVAKWQLGMVPASEVEGLKEENAELRSEVKALEMAFDALSGKNVVPIKPDPVAA